MIIANELGVKSRTARPQLVFDKSRSSRFCTEPRSGLFFRSCRQSGLQRFRAPRVASANASGPFLPFPALAKFSPTPVAEQLHPDRAGAPPLRDRADFSAVPGVAPVRRSPGSERAECVPAIPIRAAALPAAGQYASA